MELRKVLVYFSVLIGCVHCIRVCDTFLEYDLIVSPHCNETNRDGQNISEIMRGWGFTAQDYFFETQDGYIINVVRGYLDTAENKTPVLMAHGLMMNGLNWVLTDEISLGYLMGMAGYDVWIINFRGTAYSLRHIEYTITSASFWNYSFQDMGEHDLPTTVQHIKNITNKKMYYIGHSMGGQAGLIYSSVFPEHAKDHINGLVMMAPVTYLDNMKSPVKLLVPVQNIIAAIMRPLFHGFYFNLQPIIHYFCSYNSFQMYLCEFVIGMVVGLDFGQMNPKKYPLNHHNYDSVNLKTIGHFAQIIARKKFAKFDYGKDGNLQIYGMEQPPNYNASSIQVPVHIFIGPNDLLITEKDTGRFYNQLKLEYQKGLHQVEYKRFNHLDFIVAKDVDKLLYNKVIQIISQTN